MSTGDLTVTVVDAVVEYFLGLSRSGVLYHIRFADVTIDNAAASMAMICTL